MTNQLIDQMMEVYEAALQKPILWAYMDQKILREMFETLRDHGLIDNEGEIIKYTKR